MKSETIGGYTNSLWVDQVESLWFDSWPINLKQNNQVTSEETESIFKGQGISSWQYPYTADSEQQIKWILPHLHITDYLIAHAGF